MATGWKVTDGRRYYFMDSKYSNYSKAKEDSFQVTVTLQDGDTSSNVFVEKRTRTSPSDSLELRGMSQNAKVRIVFAYESGSIDNAFEYTVDFQAGTVK